MDSLTVTTDFQVSRFFLPVLKLGDNIVNYTDNNTSGTNVDLTIVWNESTENTPPQKINNPIFPLDSAMVDSLRFTFYWEQAIDADSIVDYEFQLSDRADMKYPLMPCFEVHTSKLNLQSNLNQFAVPLDGMLNSGTTYYWRVKAKDSRGAWSDWSSVWSFTPTGPMPPINGNSFVNNDTALVIKWNANSIGKVPAYYEIHSSNEWLGFSPSIQTLLDTSSVDSLVIPIDCTTPNTFYRIVAVDSSGSKSGVSDVIQALYPHVYICPDTLIVNQSYHFSLFTNQLYVKDIESYQNVIIPDTVDCQLLLKPDWLTFSGNSLMGMPTYQNIYPDGIVDTSISVQVKFTGRYSGIENTQTIIIPVKQFQDITLSNLDIENNTLQINTHPNPFDDKITIEYSVNKCSHVDIAIFNVYGQKVISLMNKDLDTGVHKTLWNASNNNAGIYFVVMTVVDKNGLVKTQSKRITKLN
ncbi:MAG: T9SS type A sorting domain-containing protein [Bacteroidia bacterium]